MAKISEHSPLMVGMLENLDIHRVIHTSCFPSYFSSTQDDDLTPLINSIREKGLLQPIIVRARDSRFEIVAGNRRYSACRSLGWRKIICHIVEADDKEAFEISLVENIQRARLKPIDEARAYKAYVQDYGWGGMSDLARKIGKSVSHIEKRIRLLGLPEEVLEKISKKTLSATVGEELIFVNDSDKQFRLAELALKKNMSSRKVRRLVKECKDNFSNVEIAPAYQDKMIDADERVQRTFDKAIITLKLALNRMGHIIGEVEENWIIHEILMQHKNMLNSQIDLLIKEKKKI